MGHSEGDQKGKFCYLRAPKCNMDAPHKHSNEYQKNCTPAPTGWATYEFVQGTKREDRKHFEAHHIVCVAAVSEHIASISSIEDIVTNTAWCVNSTDNMYAMPLWGHTLTWYCDNFEDVDSSNLEKLRQKDDLFSASKAPKFKNIPQHDYDHNSSKGYKQEVDKRLKALADQVEEKAEESHEAATKELKKQLDKLSAKYKAELTRRGTERCGGTHAAWKKGMKQPSSDWYEPFSMADDGCAEQREFPASGVSSGKVLAKLRALVAALGRWG